MPGRHFLNVPGPTNIPDSILRAMHVPSEDHRSAVFPHLVTPLFEGLKKVFKTTTGQAFIFPSSGTGAWEAVLTNTLCDGDRVLSSRFGQFSHLWIDMATRLGLDVTVQEEEWGTGASPERIHEALAADTAHSIKAVMVVQNETATGVTSDIAAVRKAIDAAKHPALLFVDGVSSIGSIDFRMDDWKVDGIIAGSQKGLMLPAGLGFAGISQKALEASHAARRNNPLRRVYFDFEDMQKTNKDGYFPYTPALPMLYGLKEALRLLFEEGLENVYTRHHFLASGVRAAVQQGWGLKLCAKEAKWESDTVSAIMVPEGFNGADVIKRAFNRYNLALGAGLSKVAGKLFRIGHLGDLNELMCLGAITGAEMAMRDIGIKVEPGSGAAAAEEYYRTHGEAQMQKAAE
jgi:alanine-glyoxylate transaminase/serine-glyoxylate transaminase/serine-pyruvate transaminase